MNGLAGCYVSTIGKPHEYFDLTRDGRTAPTLAQSTLDRFFAEHSQVDSTVLDVVSIKLVAVSYATSANEITFMPVPSVSRATSTRCE